MILFVGGWGYDRIGKGAFSLDAPDRPASGPAPGSAAADAEAGPRSASWSRPSRPAARRGRAPLDVDAEIDALTQRRGRAGRRRRSALREEVRQLVVARNERRARQGKPPLDVEAEVDRELRELGGH